MGWFVLFPYLIQFFIFHFPSSTFSLCNPHDLSALLLFNKSFPAIDTSPNSPYCSSVSHNKTTSWKNGSDCCEWDGVTCDTISGHVISLDLGCGMLQGHFHPNTTLFHLTHLQRLNLSFNDFDGDIPSTISHLSKLVSLDLSFNDFDGDIPSTISHLSKLVSLSLSSNHIGLDPSTWNKLILNASDLRELHLDGVNMSSIRESSLSLLLNLSSSLVSLRLGDTGLQGNLPTGILCLPNLQLLRLSYNENLSVNLPKSNWTTPLRYLSLSSIVFSGNIPNSIGHLRFLNQLRLRGCKFDGLIPLSLWNLTQLTDLDLSFNNLTSEISPLLSNLKHLTLLDLYHNNLEGQLPSSLFNLSQLSHLDLSSNKLVGPIPSKITKILKLSYLDLGFNKLNGRIPRWCYSLPSLLELHLNDNHLTGSINELSTYSMEILSLSNNKLHGNFPNSIHELKNLTYFDLSFNQLQGDLPIPPSSTQYFIVSHNNFNGDISSIVCNISSLIILNLSHNNLSGTIPQCLGNFPSLSVLDMQRNKLHGSLPRNFSKENTFQTIKLNGNLLEGPLPQSLSHCNELEVLDLGENNIKDIFPTWLETLQELRVLSFRSNKFHGIITCFHTKHPFPKLRVFDVSNNHFSGPLPTSYIKNFKGMMNANDSQTGLKYMGYGNIYNDSVVVIMKGQYIDLVRILTIFTTIDLSNNMFEGEIPQVIGELNSLKGLNLSHNAIIGTIPQSLSNLTNLEWLDLSWNKLTGEIPMALTNLNFLSFLNLSENQLKGMIPTGGQFNTFENISYVGSPMLCGYPLSKSCNKDAEQPPQSMFHHEKESLFGWKAIVVGYASGVIFGMLLGYNVFFNGKLQWLARLSGVKPNSRVRRTNTRARANPRGVN